MFLTLPAYARSRGLSQKYLYRLARAGMLPAGKAPLSRLWLVDAEKADAFFKEATSPRYKADPEYGRGLAKMRSEARKEAVLRTAEGR